MDNREPLMPTIGVVTDIRIDTPDVKTFRVVTPDGKKAFEHKPGQCAMLSIPGVGEAMFSITSSPTNEEYMEFSIKKCGCVTEWLHSMEVGQEITIRGPYGHPFPVDTEFVGKDMLFIAGGIGLAPPSSTTAATTATATARSTSSMAPAVCRIWWTIRRSSASGKRTRGWKST